MNATPMACFATCPKGLEYLLRDELADIGANDVREARAGAHFSGDLPMVYRVCLWTRLASRVLLPLTEFDAPDDAALYAGVRGIDWSQHMAAQDTLAVDVTLSGGNKGHSRFMAQRVKDAVVDQFREQGDVRPSVDTDEPDIRINLHLNRQRASLTLDLAGSPLHRRGWREQQGRAPLKENLAAAMLLRARWPECHAEGGILLDPMCGSGTLLIEGTRMVADVAPGLDREYFGFLGWRGHDESIWESVWQEARQRADAGLRALQPVFFGSDVDPHMIQVARHNAQSAGVAGFVQLQRQDATRIRPPHKTGTGLVITNPPYGERLGDRSELPALYRGMGEALRTHFVGWRAAILAGDADLGHAMRLHADKVYKLYNGALETPLLLFDLSAEKLAPRPPKPLSEGAQMLANRLQKNRKHLGKYLRREDIHCWRVYDRDLPEYAAAIDVYESVTGDTWLHVQEYRAPASIAEATAQQRLKEVVQAASQVFEVPRERVALKQRRRGKGGAKYGVMDQRDEFIEVEEDGLRLRVNLFDYLDTGLFPDHRLVRRRIRELAAGKRFLNLFCYTGAASVHAAAGKARTTTSVDLSATYLEWASANLVTNGFSGRTHRLMQADAMAWLRQCREVFDLIYVDPPTFSNSKRAEDFDVQRDHVALLQACAQLLAPGGTLVFSNNHRKFQLDQDALAGDFTIEDWSEASIPPDYARHKDIHHCWLLHQRA